MKENENKPVKKNINRMRLELHKLIEDIEVNSEMVRNVSCELDLLIMEFYNNSAKRKKKL